MRSEIKRAKLERMRSVCGSSCRPIVSLACGRRAHRKSKAGALNPVILNQHSMRLRELAMIRCSVVHAARLCPYPLHTVLARNASRGSSAGSILARLLRAIRFRRNGYSTTPTGGSNPEELPAMAAYPARYCQARADLSVRWRTLLRAFVQPDAPINGNATGSRGLLQAQSGRIT